MLSKTRKNSPIRMAAGLIGTGILSLAALGLTASGTQAAETLKSNVEAATGIALRQDAPPPPDAPAAPRAPRAAPTPGAAPAAPPAPRHVVRVITTDGEHGKGERRVMIVENGQVSVRNADGQVQIEGDAITIPSEATILAMVPDVQSGNCKSGDPKQMVVETPARPGERQRIMVCVNRIERVASDARRTGMGSALAGLRHARKAVEADDSLSPDKKREALSGIDSAIRELETQKD